MNKEQENTAPEGYIGANAYRFLSCLNKRSLEARVSATGDAVNAVDPYGYTPLMRALVIGRLRIADWLLDAGAATGIIALDGQNALSLAYTYNRSEIASRLEAAGASINPDPAFRPRAVREALRHDGYRILDTLMEQGVDLRSLLQEGEAPLVMQAAEHGSYACIDSLVEHGYDPDETNSEYTPLQVAAQQLDPDVMNSLIEAGADAKVRTKKGETLRDLILSIDVTDYWDRHRPEDWEFLQDECLSALPWDEEDEGK